ncbi:pyridoxamine 5'-phosphate oxidase family protein [Nocardia goodfellowii]|uniref:Nitroimidazol reductase NimA-like FMN-containing flavoprotein (Pyridoxamine 5'-phosphate oxidase superfamily) n=1 Tax=Nocardia goodfellowii TaxID=882446 RepID=A0ABS4Q6V7_9NOCA|nr:pyridoxamine 5'-phosphate oxidase family protein [Nocardia goodfellowii]MBP2187318.1 nitroimidazol reductase NimA-like FMN-containing flavoprotein (pyridoxamine 5'-phosphate oxidase superfamily) [Nocardia goodfellowii]
MRQLRQAEIAGLLADDTVAYLATIDAAGYPHVTPIWFLWDGSAFRLTSFADRPHVRRIRLNSRVGVVVDHELGLRADGQRPNRQIRIIGDAELTDDRQGRWTARIREKYLRADADLIPTDDDRILITITPTRTWAVASV